MVAVVVFGILVGYAAIAVIAVRAVVRSARRNGNSVVQQRMIAVGMALFFYLLLFWDAVPSWVAFAYFCSSESGLVERKSVSKWKSENLQTWPALIGQKVESDTWARGYRRVYLNKRVASDLYELEPVFLSVSRSRHQIVDTDKNEVLVEMTDFRMGSPFMSSASNAWKFWIYRESCTQGSDGIRTGYFSISKQFSSLNQK